MTPLIFIALALAGGIGAEARMLLDGIIKSRVSSGIPWGTITINVSGSLVLGLLTGLASSAIVPESWQQIRSGPDSSAADTTFSTASFETVRLIQERRWALSLFSGLGALVIATAAAGLGLWIGGLG